MASPAFKDHFSTGSAGYARFRPSYPDTLFAQLAALAPHRRLALDCATGSGQAAVALARRFDRVVAADASLDQLTRARRVSGVDYFRCLAEAVPVADGTVALVTVAAGLHWFDAERFYAEVERVLSPDGLIAVWVYDLLRVDSAINTVVDALYREVAAHWPPERHHVETGYRELPFPWDEIPFTAPEMGADWTLGDLVGYLGTWSATTRYRRATGRDPVAAAHPDLAAAWGEAPRRRVRWPLHLRVGRSA